MVSEVWVPIARQFGERAVRILRSRDDERERLVEFVPVGHDVSFDGDLGTC